MSMFNYIRNLLLSSKRYTFYIPTAMNESSCYPTSSQFFGVSVPDFGPNNSYIAVSYYFSLRFPDDTDVEQSFHTIICHQHILW